VSREWTPKQLQSDLFVWLDGQDPNNNNGQGIPDAGQIIDEWRDKSNNNFIFKLSPEGRIDLTNPKYMQGQIVSFTITNAGSGYTDGTITDVSMRDTADANHIVFVNITVSGGSITSVDSIGGSYDWQVGDTLNPSSLSGSNLELTVAEVHDVGGVLFEGGADSFNVEASVPLEDLHFFMLANFRSDTTGVSYFEIEDGVGSKDVTFNFESTTDADDYKAGIEYTNTSGGSSSFTATLTELEPHIHEALATNESVNFIGVDGTTVPALQNNVGADLPDSNYTLRLMKTDAFSGRADGAIYEILIFNRKLTGEERSKVHGYLEYKYKQQSLEDFAKYKNTVPTLDTLFNDAHKLSPRKPIQVVKLYLDFCDNVYGQSGSTILSTCTAGASAGSECFNTRETCQDLTNYRTSNSGKRVYTFISEQGDMLTGKERDAHPALMSVSTAPVEIQPTKGVSVRANVSIKLRDFISNDADVDPYFATRNIIALENGTYFTKLIERNPHFYGRAVEVYDGYIDYKGDLEIYDGKREYIIDSMFLDNDVCTIKCKDPMTLADELKAKVPSATRFSLGAALNSGTHNHIELKFDDVALDGSVQADKDKVTDYFGADNATGFVRINDEILEYRVDVSGSHAALDFEARGEWGSEAATVAYDADDSVQKCIVFGSYDTGGSGVTIDDVAYELLVTQAGISADLVNNAVGELYSWADEKSLWLASFKINAILSEPKEVNKQLSQLGSMVGVNFFYDDLLSQIIMRAETPELDTSVLVTITDNEIIEDSVKLINAEKERVSRVQYYYNLRDHTEDRDKPRNYKNLYLNFDVDSEGVNEYNSSAIKTIYGWGVKDTSTATSVSQRMLNRFKQTPKSVQFKMDASQDSLSTGQHFYLLTKHILNYQGQERLMQMQCTSTKFDSNKQCYEIKAKQFRFGSTNFGIVTENDVGGFDKDAADNTSAGFNSVNDAAGGTGTEDDPYKAVRATDSFISDANHITVELLSGGTGFGTGDTIEFKPDETETGATAGTRDLAVTYTQSSGAVTSIDSVSSNTASGDIADDDHDGYSATEILTGESSTGSGLSVRVTTRARMSGGQEPYTIL